MSEESELTVTEVPDIEHYEQEIANLKKKLGDQGNEIGSLRKIADSVLQKQITPEPDDDYYQDPVEKDVSMVKRELSQLKQEQALRELEQRHPGFRELPQNEAFANWIGGSKYRQNLYVKADSLDFDAADELLTAWEEQQQAATQNHQTASQHRQDTLKAASMEKGSAGGGRKQYFSRSELINLRINNPQKYEAMLPEIKAAYLEGRVRK